MKEIRIRRISYSPGYGDMLGGYHVITLENDKDGNWIYACSDRETHNEPTITTTYAVSEEALAEFEEFIIKNDILSLENRPKSDIFATDYSPWSWSIDHLTTSFGKTKREYCSFGEYKEYSPSDRELLSKLKERFNALRGEKISEAIEKR